MKKSPAATVYHRVQQILVSAQNHAARSVNTAQVVANWLIGGEIVEEQQSGAKRAGYGEKVNARLAQQLRDDGVPGYGNIALKLCRQFYLAFPHLPGPGIGYAVRNQSEGSTGHAKIGYALRNQSPTLVAGQPAELVPRIIEAARAAQWQPGQLHPGLSWTHYRALLRVSKPFFTVFKKGCR